MTALVQRIPPPATRNPFLFYTYVLPEGAIRSGPNREAIVHAEVISGVSAADAALKAAYTAVRRGFTEHAKPVRVIAETFIDTLHDGETWTRFDGTVTPTGRTFNR